jgi:hypothetical protein
MARYETNMSKIKEAQERYSKKRGVEFWKPKEGDSLVRILPPWNDEGVWYLEVPYHYGLGEENKRAICPKRLLGKKCYICEKVKELQNLGNDAKPLAEKIRAKNTFYYNILDLKDLDKGVQIMQSGVTIFKDLLFYDLDEEWGNITHKKTGYNIVINREGTTATNTKYKVSPKKNSSPLTDPSVLENLFDLSEIFTKQVPTYAELRKLYENEDDVEEDEEEAEDYKPPKVAAKAKPIVEEDEDEDEEAPPPPKAKKKPVVEEEEDDDDDDTPPPPRAKAKPVVEESSKPKRGRPPIVKEVVEEDDDDDDDDTPPPPKAGKKPKEEVVEEEEDEGEGVDVPGCYGEDYEAGDSECKECEWNNECKVETKKAKKK